MRLRNNPNALNILLENNDLVIENPENYKNNFKSLFNNDNPIYIEIGMGKGDFIYQNALKHPEINYIGIEKFPSVLVSAVNKIKQNEVPNNLKLMHYDAIELNNLFDDNTIDHIFLNFSDPWPKKKHAKRRLTSSKFLDVYKKILKKDGFIEFKTDNILLFEYSLVSINEYGMILNSVNLDLHNSDENIDNIQTEYERKFSKNGPIYKMVISYKNDEK